jgi:hypothetical protein
MPLGGLHEVLEPQDAISVNRNVALEEPWQRQGWVM